MAYTLAVMETKLENGKLIITVPLTDGHPSKTGKTLIIAGTGGFTRTDLKHKGKAVSISLNVTIPTN